MIAIFTNSIEAQKFSDKIHEFNKKNRPRYKADIWSKENKSDKEVKWMVKIPEDYLRWPVKLDIKEVPETIEKLPKDWKNIVNIKK